MTIKLKGVIVALAIFGAPAQADVYNLATDFSNISNPNGAWSFVGGSLAHYAQPSTGPANALNAAAANGYWGTGTDFFSAPFILQVTSNGSAVGYTNDDFLSGDVLVHGPNDGSSFLINWTAPSDGVIDLTSSLWYAHSIVTRSQDIAVTLNGTLLGSTTVNNSTGISNAYAVNGTGLTVSSGDILSFAFTKSANQQFGSLSGIDAEINFTAKTQTAPVPEPASWAMMIGGLALAGGAMRRRKMAVSFA